MTTLNENQVESILKANGASNARLTPEKVDGVVSNVQFCTIPGTRVVVCLLTLANGYNVLGKNMGPVDPENYDVELAKTLAYDDARRQVWPLEGYLLKQRLFEQSQVQG